MTEDARKTRNRQRLTELHPAVRSALVAVLLDLETAGWRPRIQCAWRSPEDQAEAHALGHSEVTFSFHMCTTRDGKPDALAADVLDDDSPLNPSKDYLMALARAARVHGLETGILWGLPSNIRSALNTAIDRNLPWEKAVGWDPCHIQCTGITLAQARAGVRPGFPPIEGIPV